MMKTAIPTPPVMPADRSISVRMITNVSAMDSIISAAVWVIRLAMLPLVKKKGLRKVKRMVEDEQAG